MGDLGTLIGTVLMLVALIGVGVGVRRLGWLSRGGMESLAKLLVDVFWPALIVSSIVRGLPRDELLASWMLPLSALVTCGFGLLLGLLLVRFNRFRGADRQVFLFDSLINNFVFMALPIAAVLLPGRGEALVFVHNLGMLLALWTVGVVLLGGSPWELLRSSGLWATVVGIGLVASGLAPQVPGVAVDTLAALGAPTVAVAMLVAGAAIHDTGRAAWRPSRWGLQLTALRLVLVPLGLLGLALALRGRFGIPDQVLVVFALINTMPASVGSVSIVMRYGSSANRAAEAVVWTHLLAPITIVLQLVLIRAWLLPG